MTWRILAAFFFLASATALHAEPGAYPKAGVPGLNAAMKMKNLHSILENHFETHQLIQKTRRDEEITIASAGSSDRMRLRERRVWVPLGVDPQMRKLTVRAITQRLRARSAKLKAQIQAAPQDAVWDVIFIGAGPNTATTVNQLAHDTMNEPMKTLTIEAGDLVSSNFGRLGNTFGRNSANRAAREGQLVQRGRGDKNPSSGPWGDPDIAGGEYSAVGGFSDVATLNLFASGSDVLFNAKAKVAKRTTGGPAKYQVELADGTIVYSNQVVVATGSQQKKLDIDAASLAVVDAEHAKLDFSKPDQVPGILTSSEALALSNLSETGRDAYRQKPGAKGERVLPVFPFDEKSAAASRVSEVSVAWERANNQPTGTFVAQFQDVYWEGGQVVFTDMKGLRTLVPETSIPYTAAYKPNPRYVRPVDPFETPQAVAARVASYNALLSATFGIAPNVNGGFKNAVVYGDNLVVTRADGQSQTIPLTFPNAESIKNDPTFARPTTKVVQIVPKIAVIGGKDSGRTFLEHLFGLSDETAYTGAGKRDVAQRGEVADVEWVVGAQGPADCAQFLATTRSRYLKLAGKVRDVDGVVPKAKLVKRRLTGIAQITEGEDTGKFKLTYDAGQATSVVDRVVLANGVEARPADVLEANAQLEAVTGSLKGLNGVRTLAKKVKDEEIYVTGAAAGSDVAGADEVYSTKENAASVYAFASRDRELATRLAKGARAQKGIDTSSIDKIQRVALAPAAEAAQIPDFEIARVDFDPLARLMPTSLKSVAIKHDLAEILDQFTYPGIDKVQVRVFAQGDALRVRVGGVDEASTQKIGQAILANPTLVYELSSVVGTKKPITITADVRNGKNDKVTSDNRKNIISVSSLRLEN